MNRWHGVAYAAMVSLLGACASLNPPGYSPNYEQIDKLKTQHIDRLSIGKVQPEDPAAKVNHISLRGSSLTVKNSTFAAYLEEALRSDLMEMGALDPKSTTRIDATILKNDIDVSGIVSGYGVMEVQLSVTKRGSVLLQKMYSANTKFESSFMGAIAIAGGQKEYPNLVRKLLETVYSDPEFLHAVGK